MCALPGEFHLTLCEAAVAHVSSVSATGPCRSDGMAVHLTGEGQCSVTVLFDDGTAAFSATATVSQYTGCCPGLYPDPIGVTVPHVACCAHGTNPDGGCA